MIRVLLLHSTKKNIDLSKSNSNDCAKDCPKIMYCLTIRLLLRCWLSTTLQKPMQKHQRKEQRKPSKPFMRTSTTLLEIDYLSKTTPPIVTTKRPSPIISSMTPSAVHWLSHKVSLGLKHQRIRLSTYELKGGLIIVETLTKPTT